MMDPVQHVYFSEGAPDFMAAPGAHCIDNDGNHYLCSGDYLWVQIPSDALGYMTTQGEPPEPAPERGVICTSRSGTETGYRVWITINPGGETWQWQELALAPPAV